MESSCQSGANIDGGMLWLGLDYSTINNNYPCSLTQVLKKSSGETIQKP